MWQLIDRELSLFPGIEKKITNKRGGGEKDWERGRWEGAVGDRRRHKGARTKALIINVMSY